MFDVAERGRSAHYKLTSTILLFMETQGDAKVTLAGSITRQVRWLGPAPSHVRAD